MSEVGKSTPAVIRDADGTDPRRWLAVVVLSVCVLVPFVDVTMTSIDVPKISRELSMTWVGAQWAVGGYLLVCGIGMLVVPYLGRRWGYRRVLLAGLVLFGAGGIAAAWAPGVGVFVAARITMGLGAATVLPAWVSIISAMFPGEERKRAFAMGSVFVTAVTPFGPIAGAALLDYAWFGAVFVLDAAVAALVVPLVLWLAPETPAGSGHPPDLAGIGLASGAALALFSALTLTSDVLQLAAGLAIAAVLTAGFVLRQRAATAPLVDLAVLRRPAFVWSQLTISLVNFAWTGLLLLLPTYFLVVRGTTTLMVALLLVPLAGAASIGSVVTGRVTERIGVRGTVVTGLLLFAAGLVLLSLAIPLPGYELVILALVVCGLGAGLPQAPALVIALGSMPERSAENGPGVINTLRHMGGAMGAAICGGAVAAIYVRGLPPGADASDRASVVALANDVAGHAAFSQGVSVALGGTATLLLALTVLTAILSDRGSEAVTPRGTSKPTGEARPTSPE